MSHRTPLGDNELPIFTAAFGAPFLLWRRCRDQTVVGGAMKLDITAATRTCAMLTSSSAWDVVWDIPPRFAT